MSKNELLALITNAKKVIIKVLGKTLSIKSNVNGSYSIEDTSQNNNMSYQSANELVEEYKVMNLPLESLAPWMNVALVA